LLKINAQNLRTSFWHFYPYVVFIEAVPVTIKPRQLSTSNLHLSTSIHRRILLVTEHNTIAGLTLACTFTAMAADRLFFVAFKLSLAASKTVIRP
jgi:hypothetical protein